MAPSNTLDTVDQFRTILLHALPAQYWDIQQHLRMRIPAMGLGPLAAEIP
jgi:hypothetical protein